MERQLRFEWDEAKDQANQTKHGIAFAEACDAFWDERGLLIPDPDHSEQEDRFVLLGMSRWRLVVVCHCFRGDVIRIVSARKANRRERASYLRGLN